MSLLFGMLAFLSLSLFLLATHTFARSKEALSSTNKQIRSPFARNLHHYQLYSLSVSHHVFNCNPFLRCPRGSFPRLLPFCCSFGCEPLPDDLPKCSFRQHCTCSNFQKLVPVRLCSCAVVLLLTQLPTPVQSASGFNRRKTPTVMLRFHNAWSFFSESHSICNFSQTIFFFFLPFLPMLEHLAYCDRV